MDSIFTQIQNNWNLRYTTFVDDLILFSPNFYQCDEKEITFVREANDILLGYYDNKLLYIKIEGASKYFDDELEDMPKSAIIELWLIKPHE